MEIIQKPATPTIYRLREVIALLCVALLATACGAASPSSAVGDSPVVEASTTSAQSATALAVTPAGSSGRLVGLGDSIFDWLHEDGQEIPEVAAMMLGLESVNAAQSGAYAAHPDPAEAAIGLDIRVQYDQLDDTNFDWVVMNGGFNDLDHQCGCVECVEILNRLIATDGQTGEVAEFVRRIITDGPQVMMVGYYELSTDDDLGVVHCNDIMREYSQRLALLAEATEGAWFVDGSDVVSGDMTEAFDPDGVHPSVLGARLVGEYTAKAIAAADPSLETTESTSAIDSKEPVIPTDGAVVAAGFDTDWVATGGLRYPVDWVEDESFGAGFSMYVSAWPFQQTHPGPIYQTGLPSTWMSAEVPGAEQEVYSTIEGGLGWWTATRFPTEAPKFSIGGVSAEFFEFANGTASGGGTEGDFDWQEWRWDEPQGKYGVAQLSPHVLFPPDGLNLDVDSDGGLFGYGYHPLPIIDGRKTEGPLGTVETGDNSWTVFLNTENFQGPLAFLLPEFFTKPLVHDDELAGQFEASPFLDSNPSAPNQPYDVETHDVPASQAVTADGEVFARITKTQFPDNGDGDDSIILTGIRSYTDDALAGPVANWFEGGASPSGQFDEAEAVVRKFEERETAEYFGWMIIPVGLDEGQPEHLIDFAAFTEIDISDSETFRYRWNLDLVTRENGQFVIPEYYQLVDASEAHFGKIWAPVSEADVPAETGLVDYVFPELGVRGNTAPFETPTDPDSVWQSPGPATGIFQTELGDGSVVTYAWYRFIDQPAIVQAGFSDAERSAIQARVEEIHRAWGPDGSYLEAPTVGDLALLDAGVLVEPPVGLEVGYVPIVTRQALAE